MKTKEELDALKAEVETMNRKLAELSEDELKQVTGGANYFCSWKLCEEVSISSDDPLCPDCRKPLYYVGAYQDRGYDVFECGNCGQYYAHSYMGDSWHRAYMR